MKISFTLFIYLLTLLAYGQEAHQQSWTDSIDKVIEKFVINNGPGGAVAVLKGDQILYTKAFGYADVDKQKLNNPNTIFDIASCSKQFTAASVIRLAQQGKIDLQEPIQKYFPEFKIKTPIPLHSLLTHSSGLQDFGELLLLARGREEVNSYSKNEILETIFKQTELCFEPSEEENYSNSNFAILSILVERVTNQSFPNYVKENIFIPLNMGTEEIYFMNDKTASNLNIAVGYPSRYKGQKEFIPESIESSQDKEELYGASGIRANIYGLAKWMSNYKTGTLDNGTLLIDLLLLKDTLSNGELTQYARGLTSGTNNSGYKWVQHTGRSNSTSIMLWFPDYDISIIALMNTQEIWAQSVTNEFYKDVLAAFPTDAVINKLDKNQESKKGELESPPSIVPQPSVKLAVADMKKFTGIYPAGAPVGSLTPPSGGVGVDKIVLNEDKLQYVLYNGDTIDLKPISKNILEMIGVGRPIQLRFVDLDSDKSGMIVVDPLDNDGKPAEEVVYKISSLSTAEILELCGNFSSPSLINAIPIEILYEDGYIYMKWGILKKRTSLYYLGNDILTSWQAGDNKGMQCNLIIKRNSAGQVSGFSYEGHRVWHLYFEKL